MVAKNFIKDEIKKILKKDNAKRSEMLALWAYIQDIHQRERSAGEPIVQIYADEKKHGKYPYSAELDEFVDVHELLKEISLGEFLRYITPEFVMDVEGTVRFLDSIPGSCTEKMEQLKNIKASILYVQERYRQTSEYKDHLEEIYQKCYCEKLPKRLPPLSYEMFFALFRSIGGYQLKQESRNLGYSEKKATEISAPVNTMRAAGASDEQILEFAAGCYLKNSKENLEIEIKTSQRVKTQLLKVSPIDFLCALDYAKEDNLLLEMEYLFEQLIRKLDFTSRVALFMPSMQFLRKWLLMTKLSMVPLTVVVAENNRKDLLELNYKDATYSGVICTHVTFLTIEEWKNRSEKKESGFSHILFFAQNLIGDFERTLKSVVTYAEETFIWTSEVEFKKFPVYREIRESGNGDYSQIATLPIGIKHNKKEKKKLLAIFTRGYIQLTTEAPSVEAVLYVLDKKTWGEEILFRKLERKPVRIPLTEIWTERTVRQKYQEKHAEDAPPEKKRKSSIPYAYSSEIKIWYSGNSRENGTVEIKAYIAKPSIDKKPVARSEKSGTIDGTVRHKRSLKAELVDQWLENEYPFLPATQRGKREGQLSIREIMSQQIREEFVNKAVSLKTLWYAYPEAENEFSEMEKTQLRELVTGLVGKVMIQDGMAEVLWDEIVQAYASEEEQVQFGYWSLLLKLVTYGAKATTHCAAIDLKSLQIYQQEKNRVMSEIRGELVKKILTESKFVRLENMIDEGLKTDETGRYLGAKIRLRTGLESNLVCALKTKDLRKNELGVWYLHIQRQVTNDGAEVCPLRKKESYRDFPCTDDLANLLLQVVDLSHKDAWLLRGNADKEIVCGLTPRELNKHCRDLLKELGIEDDVIMVPDEKRGTVETNLAKYYGDLLRENFRFRAAEKCGMTTGEIAYLLGVQATVTHERFYCDYSNTYKMLQMQRKLQRDQESLHEDTKKKARHAIWGEAYFNRGSAEPEAMDMELFVGKQPVVLSFSSEYGVEVSTTYYGVKK